MTFIEGAEIYVTISATKDKKALILICSITKTPYCKSERRALMVELRTVPTPKAPKGKLDGTWDPQNHTITIRNTQLGVDTTYYLDDATGTCTILETVPICKIA